MSINLTDERQFELLKIEVQLLQGVFDKYDDMIFRSRNWFATLWMATLGIGFSAHMPRMMLLAAALAVLYWILEGLMRHQYWYKYVVRYRAIREQLNESPDVVNLSVYDLTHHYGMPKPSERERFRRSFGKLEPIVLYATLGLGATVLWWLVTGGVIELPSTG